MILKLIVHGADRNHCIARLKRALNELIIDGTTNNIALHKKILAQKEFLDGTYSIKWLEKFMEENRVVSKE